MVSYSIAEARNKFTSVVHHVEDKSSVELTRHGEPVAMIISIKEYRALKEGKKNFWEAYLNFRKRVNLEADGLEADDFTDLRDNSTGREVDLWD